MINNPVISDDEAKAVTLQSYNQHIEEYSEKDGNDDIRTLAYWPGIAWFLEALPPGQTIFEIGSGTGSDARRIEKQGFVVRRSDVTPAFLELLRADGYQSESYDVLSAPLQEKQVAILANVVLLHFTPAQLQMALRNIYASLADKGMFCFSVKLGTFEGWRERGLSGKRYFKFWDIKQLETELGTAGFTILHTFMPTDNFAVITVQRA